jgi:multidrug efflux pump subunit AcrA (membrane-fusion protein)
MKFIFMALIIVPLGARASVSPPPPMVTIQTAKMSDLFEKLSYPARVESKVNASIFSESEGVVTKILTPLGTSIHRNGKVVVIKHTDPVYQYAPVVLTSPVDGVVSQVAVTEGSAVTKGQLIASVTNPKLVRTIIEVAAGDLPLISKGLTGQLSLNNRENQVFDVRVIGVSPFVDPVTGSATCELEIIQGSKPISISPGVVGQVNLKVNFHKGFVLPDYAIVYKGNDTFVRVVENGAARKIPVTVGKKERGQVEIIKGLKSGDVVIERSSGFVGDGEKVQVQGKAG